MRYGAEVAQKDLTFYWHRRPHWKGTALLQEAYDKQEQKCKEQQEKIEKANQAIAKSCCVCFEEKVKAQKGYCSNKQCNDTTIICEGCCQLLRDMEQACPICRADLVFEK